VNKLRWSAAACAVNVAMQQRAVEREHLRKEREERKQKLEQEKLVLPLRPVYIIYFSVYKLYDAGATMLMIIMARR